MGKLTESMIEAIKASADRIEYGKITICLNATSGSVDIVEEERKQFKKRPAPGVPAAGSRVTRED